MHAKPKRRAELCIIFVLLEAKSVLLDEVKLEGVIGSWLEVKLLEITWKLLNIGGTTPTFSLPVFYFVKLDFNMG